VQYNIFYKKKVHIPIENLTMRCYKDTSKTITQF